MPGEARMGDKYGGEQGQILKTLSLIPPQGGPIHNYKDFFFSKGIETLYRKTSQRKRARVGLTEESTGL